METIEEVMEYVKTQMGPIVELQKRFQRELEEEFHKVLEPCMVNVLNALGLDGVYIFGYTDTYCDGDPCEHITALPEYYDEDDNYGIEYADMSIEQRELATAYTLAINQRNCESVFNALINGLDDAFEKVYGTNWFLLFTLTDDGLEITKGDYEPDS